VHSSIKGFYRSIKGKRVIEPLETIPGQQRRRFAKLNAAVLAGIEARIFMPSKGWMCGDCQFADTCRDW